jgi:hypothetical protein
VEGVPPRMELSELDIQPQLSRRRPGQSSLTTPRDEKDKVMILSGVERGISLGTPVALLVRNGDQRPGDYSDLALVPRPSHADFTYQAKYGVKASSGGGRSSARETIGRVLLVGFPGLDDSRLLQERLQKSGSNYNMESRLWHMFLELELSKLLELLRSLQSYHESW